MAENITLNNIATFQNDTSAANTYNNNNTAIVNAFADVLSRSGVGPNQMTSTLDMNNQQIINLPAPQTATSPARLLDISGGTITIVTATTGNVGHTVPFLDGTNAWSGTNTFNSTGLNQAVNTFQTASGTTGGSGLNLNQWLISDTINAGSGIVQGLQLFMVSGGGTVSGPRVAIQGAMQLNGATNAGSAKAYYAIQGSAAALTADGGTNPNAAGTSAGEVQGGNFAATLGSSATSMFAAIGAQCTTICNTGSSMFIKALLDLSGGGGSDTVAGTGINTMLWMNNHTGSVKWTNGILIDNLAGLGQFPIATTGTIFKTAGGGSVLNGIDFTNTTFSGSAIATPGFSISSNGTVNSGTAGFSNGVLLLNGSTSGNMTFSSNATATLATLSQPMQIGVVGTTAGSLTIAGLTSGSATINCSATGGVLQMGAGNFSIDTSGNTLTTGAFRTGSSTAPVAGGDTTHAYFMSSTGAFAIYYGSGVPTITAAQGSLYLRTDGSTNITRAYINTTGSNVWTAINTVA